MEITKRLAEFIVDTDTGSIPQAAFPAARDAFIDCLGVTLAGSQEEAGRIIASFLRKLGGEPRAAVVGWGFRTPPPEAALANGTAAHALDYDDVSPGIRGHPSVVLLPPVLALGEEAHASGREVLAGYIIGFEVASRVGNAMSADYSDDLGWHPTAPLGALGAAAASARLLRLDKRQTAMALGLAASQAAGLRQNFGTMTKPFHAGNAARSGVVAALLAAEGFTAAEDVIEGRFGFCHAFSGGQGYDVKRILEGLGNPYQVVSPGVGLKRYPCCGSAHGALDAILHLIQEYDIPPEKVSRIECSVPFDPPRSLIHYRPQTGLEGKFSMHYCMAAALLDRKVGLKSFTAAAVLRPQAQRLIEKVEMHRHPGDEGKPSWVSPYYLVRVRLDDGREYQHRIEDARGDAQRQRSMTPDEIAAKYRDCASLALDESATERSLALLGRLEELEDITELMDIVMGEA